jgi:hypothetical protein
MVEVVQEDGLPLVWVPHASIVTKILNAQDRAARVTILVSHTTELIEDCTDVLSDISHEALSGQLELANRAVAALARV